MSTSAAKSVRKTSILSDYQSLGLLISSPQMPSFSASEETGLTIRLIDSAPSHNGDIILQNSRVPSDPTVGSEGASVPLEKLECE